MRIDTRTFRYAGTSADPNGNYKARFANDLEARPKVLSKIGHTNFVLVELPRPMVKSEAVAYLMETKPAGVNVEALSAKANYLNRQAIMLTRDKSLVRRGRPRKNPVVPQSAETSVTMNVNQNKGERVVNKVINAARASKTTSNRTKTAVSTATR